MLKWLIRRKIAAFERENGYDASYLRHVLDHDVSGFLRFARVAGISGYRKDTPLDLYYATSLTAVIAADCGPCTQLGVGFALKAGLPAATLAKIVEGDESVMTENARLGVRFARAVIAHSPEADELRAEIERRFGPRAVISLGLALVAANMYPTFKYALGYGKACQRIEVAGRNIVPRRAVA